MRGRGEGNKREGKEDKEEGNRKIGKEEEGREERKSIIYNM
jgi:hypothetical protein